MRRAVHQLAFDFGMNLLRRIRPAEKSRPPSRAKTRKHLRQDPILEEVARVLLKQAGCRELAKEVSVSWNPRLRTTAGLACYRTRSVILNPKLIEVSSEEVQITLRHELAHLVAQARSGRRRVPPHGAEWQQACSDLGIPNEARCHNLPFKQRRVTRRYFYQCPECGEILARVQPIKRRVACVKCCRKFHGGKYAERFRFRLVEEPERAAA
ncbi:MAG: SprT-like domain-containing protein [Chthoniobacterales bacterium]